VEGVGRRASKRAVVTRRRAFVRGFVAVLLLAGVLGGGWMWLRDSGFVRVTDVRVRGSTTSEESAIRAALDSAAREMTTLHVRRNVLDDAVAPYRSVAGLRVTTDFPHEMSIEVLEHRPVAALELDGRRVPVSSGGLVLQGVQADSDLPSIRRPTAPPDGRVTDARTRAAVAVAATAPLPLLTRADRIWWGPRGLTVDLRDGPPLYFGTGDEPAAKWAGAARVLAEPSAAGATYLDLRVPGRVAAGGLGPVAQEGTSEDAQP
jgi:cell division protein FtsQ